MAREVPGLTLQTGQGVGETLWPLMDHEAGGRCRRGESLVSQN